MPADSAKPAHRPLLSVEGMVKHFRTDGFLQSHTAVRAVDGVDLHVDPGEVVALVGESGSGKSTLARCVLGLEEPTAGKVVFEPTETNGTDRRALARARTKMQPVFQDPYSSLDPRWSVDRTIREAMEVVEPSADERGRRVNELLDRVGLSETFAKRKPHELSGGQRQRVCIAAALAAEPSLLIADEPVTALDVSVQAQILNLLKEIQDQSDLAILLIAHDLSVVAHISSRVAVMYMGRIVEVGPTNRVLSDPRHPYTQALMAATPKPDPALPVTGGAIGGEVQSTSVLPSGCRFHPRCPHVVGECRLVDPELRLLEDDRKVACHVAPRLRASRGR